MAHRKQNSEDLVSAEYIQQICSLYGDRYDDRMEDSRPPAAGKKNGQINRRASGEDWLPGIQAEHKSLNVFQKELAEKYNIRLSTSKIRKILISGGLWSTERSREVQALYAELMHNESYKNPEQIVGLISKKLRVSKATVIVNLPYIKSRLGLRRTQDENGHIARFQHDPGAGSRSSHQYAAV